MTREAPRLASEGVRFTDGHSSSGICTPSRYALLTGRHHWRKFHGIVNALGGSVFDADRLTLPEMLQEKGYATACVAGVCREILKSGYEFCTLYTDLSNPTSNSIYMKIGFNPVCDSVEHIFTPPAA